MQDGTIGRRYARALSLSLGDGELSAGGATAERSVELLRRIEGELNALAEALEQRAGNTDFRQAMLNPSFGRDARRRILDAVCERHGLSEPVRRMLRLLNDKERLPFLPQVARAFAHEVDERSGQVRAHITSARVLAEAQVASIVKSLEGRTGKKVVPELEVEPEIIGGVKARVGGLVFDNSVQSQIGRMRSALAR